MKKSVKKGGIELSFSMIFSIILIVIFIVVAFYAIRVFLGLQDSAKVGLFVDEFQGNVNTIWSSTESSQGREYTLPSEVEYICFVDFGEGVGASGEFSHLYLDLEFYNSGENMMFYPQSSGEIEGAEIEHIDLDGITGSENPFCIEVSDGKLELTLVKDFGEAEVKVER